MSRKYLIPSLSAFGGAALAVSVNMATGWLQAEKPYLVYDSKETLPIQVGDQSTAIYHLTIDNLGNKEVKEVVCSIRVPNARIERHKVRKPDSMRASEDLKGDVLVATFDAINPHDPVQISFQASGATLPYKPSVSLRGDGIVGVETSSTGPQPGLLVTPWAMISPYLPLFILLSGLSLMGAYSSVERRIKEWASIIEIDVKVIDETSLKVKVIKGWLVPKEWMKVVQGERHSLTRKHYDELRSLGNGKHHVQKPNY